MGFFKNLWNSVRDVVEPVGYALGGGLIAGPVGSFVGGSFGIDSVNKRKAAEAQNAINKAYGNLPPPPQSAVAGTGIPIGGGGPSTMPAGSNPFSWLGGAINTGAKVGAGEISIGVQVPKKPTPYDPSSLFANLSPTNTEGVLSGVGMYDPGANVRGITPFDPSGYFSGITPYDPRSSLNGLVPPSLERMLQEGTIDQSEFQNISVDPELKKTQMRALGKLQEVADQHGLTVQDRVRMRDILDQVTRQTRMSQGALRQRYEAQGLGGSGVELASSLAAEQGATEGASKFGSEVAAMAADREFQAIQESAKLAGSIRSQDYEEAARKAEAIDSINRFNAAQRSEIYQTDWLNKLNFAVTGANMGQQAFQNKMDLSKAQADAGQTAYSNKYTQAYNLDVFTRQGWSDRFNQAQAISDARRNYWNDQLNLAKTQADAGQTAYANAIEQANTRFNQELARASEIDNQNYRIWATQVGAQSGKNSLDAQLALANASRPSGAMQLLGIGAQLLPKIFGH